MLGFSTKLHKQYLRFPCQFLFAKLSFGYLQLRQTTAQTRSHEAAQIRASKQVGWAPVLRAAGHSAQRRPNQRRLLRSRSHPPLLPQRRCAPLTLRSLRPRRRRLRNPKPRNEFAPSGPVAMHLTLEFG
jgi:hypothetical protein